MAPDSRDTPGPPDPLTRDALRLAAEQWEAHPPAPPVPPHSNPSTSPLLDLIERADVTEEIAARCVLAGLSPGAIRKWKVSGRVPASRDRWARDVVKSIERHGRYLHLILDAPPKGRMAPDAYVLETPREQLTERDRTIVDLYARDRLDYGQIAERVGLSRARVAQVLKQHGRRRTE